MSTRSKRESKKRNEKDDVPTSMSFHSTSSTSSTSSKKGKKRKPSDDDGTRKERPSAQKSKDEMSREELLELLAKTENEKEAEAELRRKAENQAQEAEWRREAEKDVSKMGYHFFAPDTRGYDTKMRSSDISSTGDEARKFSNRRSSVVIHEKFVTFAEMMNARSAGNPDHQTEFGKSPAELDGKIKSNKTGEYSNSKSEVIFQSTLIYPYLQKHFKEYVYELETKIFKKTGYPDRIDIGIQYKKEYLNGGIEVKYQGHTESKEEPTKLTLTRDNALGEVVAQINRRSRAVQKKNDEGEIEFDRTITQPKRGVYSSLLWSEKDITLVGAVCPEDGAKVDWCVVYELKDWLTNPKFHFFLGQFLKLLTTKLEPHDHMLSTYVRLIQNKKYIQKSFSYYLREPIVVEADQRKANPTIARIMYCIDQGWEINSENLAESAKHVKLTTKMDGQVKYLTLPYHEGHHQPRFMKQFKILYQKLKKFHNAGCIHGDIRWQNLIFSEDGSNAWIIDFDLSYYSGKEEFEYKVDGQTLGRDAEGNEEYVSGFVVKTENEIRTAHRHPEAKPTKKLDRLHDLFSFHFYLFAFFGHHKGVNEICNKIVEGEDVEEGLNEFDDELGAFQHGTGKESKNTPNDINQTDASYPLLKYTGKENNRRRGTNSLKH